MIKSTKHILKYCNQSKIEQLDCLYKEYKELLQTYINLILKEKLPLDKFISSKKLPTTNIINSSAYKQIAYKQASEIVRSKLIILKKEVYSRYKYIYAKAFNENKYSFFTSKKFSELNINYIKRINSIDIKNVSINIDSRLYCIQYGNSFDEFIRVRMSTKQRINIPIKHHKVSRQLINDKWTRKNTIQLKKIKGQFYIIYFWEKEDKVPKEINTKVGIDIGYTKLISTSLNNHYGSHLTNLYNKITKKKQGSKSFKKALTERNREINKVVKEFINNEKPDIVYIEDLKTLKDKKGNKFNRWSYARVFNKLEQLSRTEGFLVETVDPKYTSQTCSSCGNICKESRNKQIYKCVNCNIKLDADYNASLNILHRGVYRPSTIKT